MPRMLVPRQALQVWILWSLLSPGPDSSEFLNRRCIPFLRIRKLPECVLPPLYILASLLFWKTIRSYPLV